MIVARRRHIAGPKNWKGPAEIDGSVRVKHPSPRRAATFTTEKEHQTMSLITDEEAKKRANELFPGRLTRTDATGGGGVSSPATRGALAWIFDWTFDVLVTAQLVRIIYVLLLAGLAIGATFALITSLTAGELRAVLVVPLAFLLGAFFSRVFCELLILGFRIAEHLAAIRASLAVTSPRS
jgi:hypothetical protein